MADLRYRTREDIERDMILVFEVLTGHNLFDLNESSKFRTLFRVLAEDMEELDFAISNSFLRATLRSASSTDLDRLGADEGVTRKGAQTSIGFVRLSKAQAATSDSAISAIGSIVLSNGVDTFTNTAPCRLFTGATSWVVDDGVYSNIEIPFVAQSTGLSGNAGANTVTQVIVAPSQVDTANNPSGFTGGRQSESDDEYRQRIGLERDRRAGASRFAILAQAQRIEEVSSAVVYEWMTTPSSSSFVKPSPGEVWVYAYPAFDTASVFNAGRELNLESWEHVITPANFIERVRNELETVRGFPITLKVQDPYTVTVDVTAEVTLYKDKRLADTATVEMTIAQLVRQHILNLKIGEDLSEGIVQSIISQVIPYKSATVTFSVRRSRTHDFTVTGVTGGVDAELDELIKPSGNPIEFGTITIITEE